ncbi:hypothetical protein O1L60_31325 [Streptomyces diastatochromogenes]|nr:hypothetical protein [Streptomyces diastatochromogenes]
MGRLTLRRILDAVLMVLAHGCAASAGALQALYTVGVIPWTPLILALFTVAAIGFAITIELVEHPKKGPKHAVR